MNTLGFAPDDSATVPELNGALTEATPFAEGAILSQEVPEAPTEPNLAQPPAQRSRWRRVTAGAVLTGFALLGAACTGSKEQEQAPAGPLPTAEVHPLPTLPELDSSRGQHLLSGTWNMPGAIAGGGKLQLIRTNEAVLALPEDSAGRPPANPEYEANPPVNLYGSHLQAKQDGNLGVAMRLQDVKGPATISLLGSPNIRFDEHIYRQSGLDIIIDGTTVSVRVYGDGGEPATSGEIKMDRASSVADVVFAQIGEEIHINVNGKALVIPAQVIKKQLWFGFDANATISALDAYPVKGNEFQVVNASKMYDGLHASPNGLASIAAKHGHKQRIGTAVDLAELVANPEYAKFVIANFNQLETENLAKFQALQPEEGKFQFAELDSLVDFATKHGMTVHGHALVFTEAYPKWLSDKLNDPSTTREEAVQLMTNHITTVMTRYNGRNGHGRIDSWDVVNEFGDPDEWGQLNQQSLWYKKIGADYIKIAFQAAQKADPNADLFLNDWAGETDADRFGLMSRTARSLKKAGIRRVGLGFQAHFDEDTLDDNDAMDGLYSGALDKDFTQLRRDGILVRISEASVAENDDIQTQADVHGMLGGACMHAANCTDINLWGAVNSEFRYFYFTGGPGDPGNDAPATQSADGKIKERPAMAALRSAVS